MILVCTATQTEHDAVVAGIHDSGATDLEVLVVGVGPAHAAKKLRQRLVDTTRPAPSRIVSTGFAGIVKGNVPFASWITTEKLFDWDGDSSALTELSLAAPTPLDAVLIGTVTRCELVSTDHLVDPRLEAVPAGGRRRAQTGARSPSTWSRWRWRARRPPAAFAFTVARLVSDTPRAPAPRLPRAHHRRDDQRRRARPAHPRRARGDDAALGDPRGVARLLLEGKSWTRRLRAGWSTLADALTAADPADANPRRRERRPGRAGGCQRRRGRVPVSSTKGADDRPRRTSVSGSGRGPSRSSSPRLPMEATAHGSSRSWPPTTRWPPRRKL